MITTETGSKSTEIRKQKYDDFCGQKVRKEIPEERVRLYEGIFILLVTIGLIIVTKAL